MVGPPCIPWSPWPWHGWGTTKDSPAKDTSASKGPFRRPPSSRPWLCWEPLNGCMFDHFAGSTSNVRDADAGWYFGDVLRWYTVWKIMENPSEWFSSTSLGPCNGCPSQCSSVLMLASLRPPNIGRLRLDLHLSIYSNWNRDFGLQRINEEEHKQNTQRLG